MLLLRGFDADDGEEDELDDLEGSTNTDRGDALLLLLELDDAHELLDELLLVDEVVLDGGSARDLGCMLLLLRELDVVDTKED